MQQARGRLMAGIAHQPTYGAEQADKRLPAEDDIVLLHGAGSGFLSCPSYLAIGKSKTAESKWLACLVMTMV